MGGSVSKQEGKEGRIEVTGEGEEGGGWRRWMGGRGGDVMQFL